MQALEGIRILDLTRALAGPFCTMMLADLGADVIKMEQPGAGDESRGWGPPFVGEPFGPHPGESAYFLAANRNKRSITVNMKDPSGNEIVRRLACMSDVFVENYRTGTLERMRLGYEHLHELNPGLVYCSISGYGRTGPYADHPGYDFVLQAEGGLMGITGPEYGAPYRLGIPIVDITTGMFAATAILAALRARDRTGQGQLIDMALLDSEVALLTNIASNYLIGGEGHRRLGNAHPNIAPYEAFLARDRWFALSAGNNHLWATLCDTLGQPQLKLDPRFISNSARVTNRPAMRAELDAVFATRDADEWLAKFREAGLPCAPINTIPEVFAHPQAQSRELIMEVEHPSAGKIRVAGFPYKLSDTPATVRRPPPRLGEHTEEVLVNLLHMTAEEVAALRNQAVV